jgi:predicted PurR-regulated permease PerM
MQSATPPSHPGAAGPTDPQPGTPDPTSPDAPVPDFNSQRRLSPAHRNILFAFGVALALAVAWELRDVLIIIYVSALFAVVLMPVVNGIVRFELRGGRCISRGLAITLLLGSVTILLAVLLSVGLPPVIHDIRQFATDLPSRIPVILSRLHRVPMADRLGVDNVAQRIEGGLSATATYLVASFPKWMERIFDLLTTIVLCVYFMLEGEHAYQWLMSLLAIPDRLRLAVTLEKAELRMSRWLFGQALLMLILGVCSIVAFGVLHVRYFVLLGVLMGLMNIIPIAGGVITISIVAAIAALDSWSKALGVLIFYLVYVNVENAYLTPRIMQSSVNLMGLSVLIALLAGTSLAGVVGALVAVPTAALISVLMDEYIVHKDWQEPTIEP